MEDLVARARAQTDDDPRVPNWVSRINKVKEGLHSEFNEMHKDWRVIRKKVVTSLFVVYVLICAVVPLCFRSSVSCSNGFFWEQHAPFIIFVFATKFAKVYLVAYDQGLDGIIGFSQLTFFLCVSTLGMCDAYQDSVSIQIASICAESHARDVDAKLAPALATSMGIACGRRLRAVAAAGGHRLARGVLGGARQAAAHGRASESH